jgi:hypothetical protein
VKKCSPPASKLPNSFGPTPRRRSPGSSPDRTKAAPSFAISSAVLNGGLFGPRKLYRMDNQQKFNKVLRRAHIPYIEDILHKLTSPRSRATVIIVGRDHFATTWIHTLCGSAHDVKNLAEVSEGLGRNRFRLIVVTTCSLNQRSPIESKWHTGAITSFVPEKISLVGKAAHTFAINVKTKDRRS